MKTLVIGYGNDSRNDDGAGWYVGRALTARALPGLTIETAFQLEVDSAELVHGYDLVIFVDAAVPEAPAPWTRTEVRPGFRSHAVAHFLTPADVLGLCQSLYGPPPRGVLFSIRGQDFDFGERLSPATETAADEVVEEITALVNSAVQNSDLPHA
ncbi:hydrogenase maturation protease [bacterium]|nr:hydrogenase maturation protease [bacterium]